MKSKNSAGYDNVSNKMIKVLPSEYIKLLVDSYNDLFTEAYWGERWKISKTICFNKVDNPAPSTNQLRPISLLPIFGKIYERLFILRFSRWLEGINALPRQQSGARARMSTLTRMNHLVENVTELMTINSFTPIIFVDFLQAFDMLWNQGLILKLHTLLCPKAYLIWIKNYFTKRSMIIEYDKLQSRRIEICRGAPQGSVFGPLAFIVALYDLPSIFDRPENVHLYVDDLAIVYIPSIHLNYQQQQADIERRMNNDLEKLYKYTSNWCQPVNARKTEYLICYKYIRCPKINIKFNDITLVNKPYYKYLGCRIDARLSFQPLINDQMLKLKKTYSILKTIHRQFPTFYSLKKRFFTTYAWPHLYLLSTFYCLLSTSSQNRLNSFYRRCQRLIYCLYQCPSIDLHEKFGLPTLEALYKTNVNKRLNKIQLNEPELISGYLQRKNVLNIILSHYDENPCIPWLQQGRPNKKMVKTREGQDNHYTFLDKLILFART